ncbi:SDR family oxidoreductase [Kibdelosporangium aridum]|nr:SDR family oxidoreductase [Kibdelosporangium aridum]
MTGATGFLGLHLLQRHLTAGRRVIVLAHVNSPPAWERIEYFLANAGTENVPPALVRKLVDVVEVDIAEDRMGLSREQHQRLALSAEELWHVAASVTLHRDDAAVWRTNVVGTEQLLRLASSTAPHVPVRHVSTAFVAGRTPHLVTEDDSLHVIEFENTYEKSKHTAEGLVRDWTRLTGRSTLVLRPSILVPGAQWASGLPTHTLETLHHSVAVVTARTKRSTPRLVVRFAGDPRAWINLLQVDWAAEAMMRLATLPHQSGTHTFHVTHPNDVPVLTIAAAFEELSPVRIRITPAQPAEPTLPERVLYRRVAGFLPYLHHRRSFSGTRLAQALPQLAPPAPIDRGYLERALGVRAANQSPARGLGGAVRMTPRSATDNNSGHGNGSPVIPNCSATSRY